MRSERQMDAWRMEERKGGGRSDDEPTYNIHHLCRPVFILANSLHPGERKWSEDSTISLLSESSSLMAEKSADRFAKLFWRGSEAEEYKRIKVTS
ncbi:hypothetical protein NQZ68_017147 [Dissostichus eleginoides]|nr:hypothetical protein NQZ68_017147 [Dissostichus eleginoides]